MNRHSTVLRTTVLFPLLIACCVINLVSCRTTTNGKSDQLAAAKKAQEPSPLAEFKPQIQAQRLWARTIGRGEKRLGIAQHPVVLDGRVYAAAVNQGIFALNLETGEVVWHVEPKARNPKAALRLSGGPGVGGGHVVVGSLDGQVIALNQATGAIQWRAYVSGEIIAAPAVDQSSVYIHTTDGRVTALDAESGSVRWSIERDPPSLSVRGSSPVLIGPGVVFIGQDNGNLTTVSAEDGHALWDQMVGSSEGRTEIERMADVDGQPVLEGDTLYATSYKNTTVAFDAPNARVIWTSPHGGEGGLGVSSGDVVVSDRDGVVWALDKTSGSALWSQTALSRRALSPPAIHGDYAVVGDYKGYLHWLSLNDGSLAGRFRLGHAPIVAQPVVAGAIVIVQTTHGQLAAFRLHSL